MSSQARSIIVSWGLAAMLLAVACGTRNDSADPRTTCTTGDCTANDGTQPSDTSPGSDAGPPSTGEAGPTSTQTDDGCGGPSAPKCAEGKKCLVDSDCLGACNHAKRCVDAPSCKPHLGGDTCGKGEVGSISAQHESCCRTLPVKGYADASQPGKTVYLDKYEITTGRIRAFLAAMSARYGGQPNVRAWIAQNQPPIWDGSWSKFLPADVDGEMITIDRRLLGDPRGTWPGAPPIPATDEGRKTGTDFQFNGHFFVYVHGSDCSTHKDAWGFPTWFYPATTLAKMGPEFLPRANGTDFAGKAILASDHLEVKAMNCIPNALLQAFCHWDGGQLATNQVLDFVTASPPTLGNEPGCGTQVGWESPPMTNAAMKGGRCADLDRINATYDAGGSLPTPEHPRNVNSYVFPFFAEGTTHDKAWEVAAPGRGTLAANGDAPDQVRIAANDEPWMDLAGNLSEAVLVMNGKTFTGRFGLKYRGIGYQSARSLLNVDTNWDQQGIARIERPEAKAAFTGGRCMRFK